MKEKESMGNSEIPNSFEKEKQKIIIFVKIIGKGYFLVSEDCLAPVVEFIKPKDQGCENACMRIMKSALGREEKIMKKRLGDITLQDGVSCPISAYEIWLHEEEIGVFDTKKTFFFSLPEEDLPRHIEKNMMYETCKDEVFCLNKFYGFDISLSHSIKKGDKIVREVYVIPIELREGKICSYCGKITSLEFIELQTQEHHHFCMNCGKFEEAYGESRIVCPICEISFHIPKQINGSMFTLPEERKI